MKPALKRQLTSSTVRAGSSWISFESSSSLFEARISLTNSFWSHHLSSWLSSDTFLDSGGTSVLIFHTDWGTVWCRILKKKKKKKKGGKGIYFKRFGVFYCRAIFWTEHWTLAWLYASYLPICLFVCLYHKSPFYSFHHHHIYLLSCYVHSPNLSVFCSFFHL